jgi:hypothetical protein
VLDTITADRVVTLIALFAVPPFVASSVASRNQTLIVAIYSIALTVPGGPHRRHLRQLRARAEDGGGRARALAAVRVATVRDRASSAMRSTTGLQPRWRPARRWRTRRRAFSPRSAISWMEGRVGVGGLGEHAACVAVWQAPA